MYVLCAIRNDDKVGNFGYAMFFQMIGICLLIYIIFTSILKKAHDVGYSIPLIMVTIVYNGLLDIVSFVFFNMTKTYFVLVNIVLFFVYCLVSVPMYIMGNNRK